MGTRYPVQNNIRVTKPSTLAHTGNFYIESSMLLSASNHRLYRQGKVYTASVTLADPINDQVVEVYRLRDTWSLQKAWALAKKTWQKNTSEERKLTTAGRWHEFPELF